MEKLGFIVAGSQKCGTSALYTYLAAHPGLSPSSRKELHFFDDETVDWRAPDYGAYHAHFAGARPGMRFEITPVYLFWPQAMERIRRYRADMPLIFTFRDPAERAFSQWCMNWARGNETLPFAAAIREPGRARLASADVKQTRNWTYVERGFYGAQLEQLLKLFPREQLLFLRAEDLAREPQPVLDRICDFVGIARLPGAQPVRVHTRKEIAYPSRLEGEDISYLAGLYRDDLGRFAELSGLDISSWPVMRDRAAMPA